MCSRPELGEERAVADALGADAGPDGVDGGILGGDRDLAPEARLAGDRLDRHGAVLDLGDLGLEQPADEEAARPGDLDLRLPRCPPGVEDDDHHRLAGADLLARDLLLGRHDALRPAAHVEVDGAVLDPVDDTGGELAAVLGGFAHRLLALQVADVAEHRLLGGLGRHPGEVVGRQLGQHLIALGVVGAAGDGHPGRGRVDVDGDVAGRVEGAPVGVGERLLDRLDQLIEGDTELAVELLERGDELGVHKLTVRRAASTTSVQPISSSPALGLSTAMPASSTAASTPSTTPSLFSP